MHVQFAAPHWLWIGALACAGLGALLLRANRRRARAISLFAGARPLTSVSDTRRRAKQGLVLLGVAALFAALARPQAGFRWEETQRQGIDLMFAVDTSKSMLATDLRPDRLTRAKLAVRDLVREFPGERYGLIAFAGDAFVQAPMTIDQAVFEESLDALDTSIIPRGGTDIASAIRTASTAMASEPGRRKLLVLLSDGEDLAGDAVTAAADAGRHGLTIYTVGVGTTQGELIPIAGADGRHDLVRDANGEPVRSHLDAKTLGEIAGATGGAYAALGPSGRGLETLYREQLSKYPRRTVEERLHKVYTERFQIPLGVAIGCLLLELALGERKRGGSARAVTPAPARASSARRAAQATAAALILLFGRGEARAAAPAPTAVTGGVPAYNEGTGAYRKRDFAAARDRFQSATRTDDLNVQENAYYDLGNARYRLGQATQEHDVPATVETWKGALAAYDGALSLHPNDADAKFNRALVARRLAALQEQQKQEQQKQEQQKQEQQKQNKQSRQQQPQSGKDQKSSRSSAQQQGGGSQQQKDGQKGQQPPSGQSGGQQQSAQHQRGGQSGQQANAQPRNGTEKTPQSGQQQSGQGEQKNGEQKNGEQTPGQQQASGRNPGQQQTPPPAANGTPSQAPGEKPSASGGPGTTTDERDEETRRQAGALSRGEANQLLNSVDGQLQRLPMAGFDRRATSNDKEPAKDW